MQLKNVLNRSAVPADPSKNVKSTEDFLYLVLIAHIVVAAQELMKTKEYDVLSLSEAIVQNFVELGSGKLRSRSDRVRLYATELLTLGLLWHSFHDAIREGDGDRVILHWKFMMVAFRVTKHHNYAKEACTLLMQTQYLASPRMRAQIVWGRFINTLGKKGCNISCDLHLEHLNRKLKSIIANLGANKTVAAIKRASKTIGTVHHICHSLEAEYDKCDNACHPVPRFGKDLTTVIDVLTEANVFVLVPKRKHPSFRFKCNLFEAHSEDELLSWLFTHVSSTIF